MKIVFLLLFISSVLGSLIPITAISPKELEELQGDPHITHKVVFHIRRKLSKDQYVSMGELVFGLFGGTTPITVKNFALLSEGTLGFGYEDSIFHRVIDGFVVQGGDFQYGQGYGGHSIYNDHGKFDDENFILAHNKPGRLSMANAGPNTNGAQFFICQTPQEQLDGKHVVFGQLINGFDTLAAIASTPVDNSKPIHDILIQRIEVYTINNAEGKYYDIPNKYLSKDSTNYLLYFIVIVAIGFAANHYRKSHYRKELVKDKEINANFYHK